MRRAGVFGPYQHRRKWRIVVVRPGGERAARLYDTEAEALEVIAKIQRDAGLESAVTCGKAIDEYELAMKEKGNLPRSVNDTIYRLKRIVGSVWLKRPLRTLGGTECERLYKKLAGEVAVDSHRNMLAEVKTWGRWCVEQKHVRVAPFASVKGVGRRKKGKPQLRLDEGRRFFATARRMAGKGDQGATGALLLLCLGLRIGEAVKREVRDVDDAGRIIWIPESKTPAGRRELIVPTWLRPHLVALTAGKGINDPLFLSTRVEWLRKSVRRICKAAGVPYVPPHGLRGSFATFGAQLLGGVTDTLAGMVGHEDAAFTGRVYARPGAGMEAIAEGVSEMLSRKLAVVR